MEVLSLGQEMQVLSLGQEMQVLSLGQEDPGSIPGAGRSPGEGNDYPLQYSCLKNLMDREESGTLQFISPWHCKVSNVTE